VLLPRQADGDEQEETRYGTVVIRPFDRCFGHRSADYGRRHVLRQIEKAVASMLLLLRLVCRSQVRQADLLLLQWQVSDLEEQVSRLAEAVPVQVYRLLHGKHVILYYSIVVHIVILFETQVLNAGNALTLIAHASCGPISPYISILQWVFCKLKTDVSVAPQK